MWPRKNRAPAISGICLIAMVAGWSGLAAPGARSADGTGTITVSPTVVPASATTALTFVYTASAGQDLDSGSIELDVPSSWTPPSLTGQGAVTVACADIPPGNCNVSKDKPSIDGQQVVFNNILLAGGQALDITYGDATVPASGGTATFSALEQSTTSGSLTGLLAPAVVTVTCPDGTGTETVTPGTVTAASTSALTFTYTPATGCALVDGGISLTVPPGWTLPSAAPGAAGLITVSPASPGLVVSGSTVSVNDLNLAAGQALTIVYSNATAPESATTSTFATSEQTTSTGTLARLLSPQVTIKLPKATPTPTVSTGPAVSTSPASPHTSKPVLSTGTMTVAPATVPASHPGTLTFTYQAPARGLPFPGELTLLVPPGWTPPSASPGRAGYATSTSGALSVSGRRIFVAGLNLGPGQRLAITYRPAAAPRATGRAVFKASERPGSDAVLAALTSSPSVMVAGPSPYHFPVQLLLVLLAAGCVAAVSAVRYLRRRPPTPPPPSVKAVPQAGPAGPVTVQYSGTGVTHAVSIEPHPGAPVITIEETRP